jgi:hypothetical protein
MNKAGGCFLVGLAWDVEKVQELIDGEVKTDEKGKGKARRSAPTGKRQNPDLIKSLESAVRFSPSCSTFHRSTDAIQSTMYFTFHIERTIILPPLPLPTQLHHPVRSLSSLPDRIPSFSPLDQRRRVQHKHMEAGREAGRTSSQSALAVGTIQGGRSRRLCCAQDRHLDTSALFGESKLLSHAVDG